jgi:hypothetical protein
MGRRGKNGLRMSQRRIAKSKRDVVGCRTHLSRPIQVKAGPKLETLAHVRDFILAEPGHVQERPSWQLVAAALLEAAEGREDLGVATYHTENALFLQARWFPPACK